MAIDVSDFHEAWEEAFEDAKREAAREERGRIAAITNSSRAEGRERLAWHLAFETEISAEDAIQQLATSPLDPPESVRARLN